MLKELSKKERILKEMESRIKSPYIKIDDDVRNILSYLYDHQNKLGKIFFSMRDMIMECRLFYLGEYEVEVTKNILIELEHDVLSSTEDLIGITEEHYDELIILEFIDEFK